METKIGSLAPGQSISFPIGVYIKALQDAKIRLKEDSPIGSPESLLQKIGSKIGLKYLYHQKVIEKGTIGTVTSTLLFMGQIYVEFKEGEFFLPCVIDKENPYYEFMDKEKLELIKKEIEEVEQYV